MRKFDSILNDLGPFGRYQKQIYFLMCLTNIPSAFNMVMSVFLLGVPKHRCSIPGYSNDTYEIHSEFHRDLVNMTIPPFPDDTLEYSPCFLYQPDNGTADLPHLPCSLWVYETSVFVSTFASEQNMVCGDKWRTSHAQTIFFAGVLIGSFGLGSLSDVIGRKTVLCTSLTALFASSLGLAWTPNFAVFCVMRFIIGFFCAGIFVTAFVLAMELVGTSKRVWAGTLMMYFFSLGIMIMAGVGYGLKHWKYIEITCAASMIFFLLYVKIVPESPRWYFSQGRFKEGNTILLKAAKVNKVSIKEFDEGEILEVHQRKGRFWHLFTSRTLLIRSLIIFFNWMVASMVYYGLSLSTGNLGGDFYLNLFLSGVVEIPALSLVILLLDRVGRSRFYSCSIIFGGVFCICTIFTMLYGGENIQPITVTLGMLGKLGITAAYAVVYIWSAELFPTVLRNAAVGIGSASARIGGMISPYVVDLNKHIDGNLGRAVPLAIFGGLAIIGGLLSMYLPETRNEDLADMIEEGNHLGEPKLKPGEEGTELSLIAT